MEKVNEEQLEHEKIAYKVWKDIYFKEISDIDTYWEPYFRTQIKPWRPHQDNILKKVREALLLSPNFVAERAQIPRSTLFHIEKKETSGEVSLKNLYQTAEAMDCELIYGLRPKNKKIFAQALWDKLLPEAKKSPIYNSKNNMNWIHKHKRFYLIFLGLREQLRKEEVIQRLGLHRRRIKYPPHLFRP